MKGILKKILKGLGKAIRFCYDMIPILIWIFSTLLIFGLIGYVARSCSR